MKLRIIVLSLLVVFFVGLSGCDESARSGSAITPPPLNALIVTGQCNRAHDWTKTSPVFKILLEQTGLFAVDVATSPAKGQDMSSYKPDFAAYDVVVLDYDGDEWPQQTKDNFVEYVKNGGGVVLVHASNNSFPKWKEYNEIIGLGGWGGRNQRSGPMVRYRDGKIVLDFSPGRAGSHGPPTPYQVVTRAENPILNDLPEKWMHAKDELYCNLRGPAKNLTVLSTAYADPANKGTGEHEPVLFTIKYGKGRVFHNIMGHVRGNFISSVECVGFITTFQRGAEWAATGEVTQQVPVDFPTADKVMSRRKLKVPNIDRMLADLAGYKYQDSRETLAEVDSFTNLFAHNTEMLAHLEQKFIDYLNSDATLDSKQFICKKLALIGTKASVKTLGKMLTKQETSDMALMAIEQIDDPSVDELLVRSVKKTSGNIQAGIINTIGKRKDAKAVKVLSRLVNSNDAQVQASAITALGKIADSKALGVLEKNVGALTGGAQMLAYDSYLKCVDKIAKTEISKAFGLYEKIYNSDAPSTARVVALNGMLSTARGGRAKIIIEALKQDDRRINSTAALLVTQLKDPRQLIDIASAMGKLSSAGQVQLITALAATGQKAVFRQVQAFVISDDEQVSLAAIKALGVLGNESAVQMLVDIAAISKGEKRQVLRESLYRLKGPNVDQGILAAIAASEPKAKIELIKAVSNRKIANSEDTLFQVAKGDDAKVSVEAMKALKVIAGTESIEKVIDVLLTAKDSAVQKEAQRTLVALSSKNPVKQGSSVPIVAAINTATTSEAKTLLVQALGKVGDDDSLEILYASLQSENGKLVRAAVNALSGWPNSKPAEKLLDAAAKSEDQKIRALALRGLVKVVGSDSDRNVNEVADLYKKAVELAASDDEKKMVISGLSEVRSSVALRMTASFLKDPALKQEAQFASLKIASDVAAKNPQLTKSVMNKIIAGTDNSAVKDNAKIILDKISAFADYIVTWKMSGPYMIEGVGGQELFGITLAPEEDGSLVEWHDLINKPDAKRPYIIDLGKMIGGDNRVVYAKTNVYSPVAQKTVLELGSDDGVKVWVNDALVHANNATRPVTPGSDKTEVDLIEGSNTLLVKSVQVGGNWGFCVRFRTADGEVVEGLKVGFEFKEEADPVEKVEPAESDAI